MTREEVNELIRAIQNKVKNGVRLTDFEYLILEEVKLSNKENRDVSIRAVEEYKFWMD